MRRVEGRRAGGRLNLRIRGGGGGEAGRARLRPILMSALIAVLTLLPLALGISRGAGLQTPLATAIIAGLVVGAPLVLCFLPMLLLALTPRERASAIR